MFLTKLNKEQQDFFIKLAICLSSADGILSDEEKDIFKEYENELHRTLDIDFSDKLNFEDVLGFAPKMTREEELIVFFELVGLSLCDGLHKSEEEILVALEDKFNVSKDQRKYIDQVVTELFDVYKKVEKIFE